MRMRTILAAAAVSSALAGVVIAFIPSLSSAVPLPELPVSLLGVLALIFAFFAVQARRRRDRDAADLPDVEVRQAAPRPGAEFDDLLANAGSTSRHRSSRRQARARIKEAAVDVLVATEGVSRDAAEDLLDAGEWTDDRYAAALFSDNVAIPLRAVVYGLVGPVSPFDRQVRHAVEELRARTEEP